MAELHDMETYRLMCDETEFHPSRIILEKVDTQLGPQGSRQVRDAQSNLILFRNNLYQSNINGNPSMQVFQSVPQGMRQRQVSNADLVCDVQAISCTDEIGSCGKKTVWKRVQAFFDIFRRKKSQNQRHNSIGALKLNDLKVHGFKNTKKTEITGFSDNVLKMHTDFPNLMFTSTYEMLNWGKSSSHKVSGNGRMEITLKNVKVKISMPIIETNHEGQKEMKAISPRIEIKMSR